MKIEIIDFSWEYSDDFKNLNVEWLQKYFVVEEADEKMLTQPEAEILEKGVRIYLAKVGDRIVGTASLLKEHGVFQLAKMAVTADFKGQGIGNTLMEHCLQEAKKLGAEKIILLSNRSLKTALRMYQKFGFVEVPLEEETPYERCNIKMELKFN